MSDLVSAAVAVDALQTEMKRFPSPDTGADDGILAVEIAGVCGTDWEIYQRESRGRELGPLILGHENVGRISAVGQQASRRWGVGAGDRVVIEEFIPCGHCRLCRAGHYRICEATDSRSGRPFLRYGSTPASIPPALWGGFAELLYLHPNSIVYPLPEELPGDLAALFVPISNGIRWVVQEGGGTVGQSIVIQGPGQHGLGCVVAAKEAGMGPIIVGGLARDASRLEIARELGADHVVQVDESDLVAEVADFTDGHMADLVIDVTPGATVAVELAMEVATKRGTVILAGSKHGRPVSNFLNDVVVKKELTIKGVRGHDRLSVEPALRLIASRRYPLERLCTHRFGLDEVDRALRMVGERADPAAVHVNVVPA